MLTKPSKNAIVLVTCWDICLYFCRDLNKKESLNHTSTGSQVWAGCLSVKGLRRVNTLLFKTIKLHCRDFSRLLSNSELCSTINLRSFNSVRIIRDTTLLHDLSTNLTNTRLTQSFCSSRFPDRLSFFDNSQWRVGKGTFINRAKWIADLIPFVWANLNKITFKRLIYNASPLHISWCTLPELHYGLMSWRDGFFHRYSRQDCYQIQFFHLHLICQRMFHQSSMP